MNVPESASMADSCLEFLTQSSEGLHSMGPFLDLFRENSGSSALRTKSQFIVAQTCNLAPEELILAAGAVPVRLDIFQGRLGASDNPAPVDVCCAVRELSASLAQEAFRPDLLILGSTCDGRAKLASRLAQDKDVMALEVPRSKRGEKSMVLWRSQMKALVLRLERLTGRRIKRKSLLESIDLLNRRTSIMRAINELRILPAPPISGLQAMLVMQAAFISHPEWWCEHAQSMLDELKAKEPGGESRPKARILLTGSSLMWPDYGLLRAISTTGAEVVADETCAGTNHLHHPVVVDEKDLAALIAAVSEKSLLPHTCPFFSEYRDRLDRISGLVKKYKVDGVIHHSLRGCQLFQMEYGRVKSLLDDLHIPCMDIHTELGQAGESSMQNRIDAFVEMLSARSSPVVA